MASGKISPRQKMINMMYLVLTALLAMNVSAEILNAFKTVNRSLDKTISVMSEKNKGTYGLLGDALADPQQKVKAATWKPVADQIKGKSDDLYNYIEKFKNEIKDHAGRKKGVLNEQGEEYFKDDDLHAATKLMIEGKKGAELYTKVNQYKKDVLAILSSTNVEPQYKERLMSDIKQFEKDLPISLSIPAKDKYGKAYPQDANGWSLANFYSTPAIAGITILTKLQSDVKSSEGILSDYCLQQIGKVKIIYDKFAAVAAANTTYCMPGEEIEVSAGVGAFNDQAKPVITINGSTIPLKDGMAVTTFKASGSGEKTIPVTIRFTTPDGEVKTENRTIKYTIGTPSGAALMLDKMNVFYIGLDNPVTVSSGVGHERTKVSATGGGVTLRNTAPGKYVVNATTVGKATVSVSDGRQNTPFEFRVKTVPNPLTTIGGVIKGGKVKKGTLQVQQGVIALLENFDFQASFDVMSFEFTYKPANGDPQEGKVQGGKFSPQWVSAVKDCRPNDIFFIENVKVKGPDKSVRGIPGLSVQISK
jgi:gliding motility-associated protein GldM